MVPRSKLSLLAVFASLLLITQMADAADERPNILWITAEDMSPTLGCYGDGFATSPAIDQLATESTRYTHAFATSPVCSPSRACLIHGTVATTLGTHPMRSLFPVPSAMRGFPALLRDAGYYTSNNVKTDYNTSSESAIIQSSWDANGEEASWRGRAKDQPFFAVMNLMTSHQSRTMVWPYEQFQQEVQGQLGTDQIHDPQSVPLPPYYPDTPLVRKTVARYYDCVAVMDAQVGKLLAQLEADGLVDNTIVFFYSDHGSGMPRHKRALFDSGMRVPLLVRFPEKYKQWAPTKSGDTSDRLVCFEDFAPTVLSLTGIESQPDWMRGQAFLGPTKTKPHSVVFGHRDRVDEILDMARSVRSKRFLYIRNFMPHLGYNQQSAWIDQGQVRQDFYALERSGKANAAQQQYLRRNRPVEELYDCESDPLNLVNLVDDAGFQLHLESLRQQLDTHMVESRDLGLVPEIELWQRIENTAPMQWASSGSFQSKRILDAAKLVGVENPTAILAAMKDEEAAVRYWAVVGCHSLRELTESMVDALNRRLDDSSVAVSLEAAAVLGKRLGDQRAMKRLMALTQGDDLTVVLHAARMLEWIQDPRSRPAIEKLAARFKDEPGDLAWVIRFTTEGYLSRVPSE